MSKENMPEPAEDLVELTNELIGLIEAGTVSEISLKHYEVRAKKLMSHNPAAGHNLLGVVYSERKEFSKALHHHELACKSDPNQIIYLFNYRNSAEHNYDAPLAIKLAKKAEQLEPTNLQSKSNLIQTLFNSCRYFELAELVEGYANKNQLDQVESLVGIATSERRGIIVEQLRSVGITDDSVMSVLYDVAADVAREAKFKVRRHSTNADDDNFYLTMHVGDVGIDSIINKNMELADKRANLEEEKSLLSRRGSISFAQPFYAC